MSSDDDDDDDDDDDELAKRQRVESGVRRWKHTSTQSSYAPKALSEAEMAENLESKGVIIRAKSSLVDMRVCVLCKVSGDLEADGPGRLLVLNADKWVHLNCALWSYEVYETMNGSLVNVEQAVRRGGSIECVVCAHQGATIACFRPRCTNLYHLQCAIKDRAVFYQDKTVLCQSHASKVDYTNILNNLSVFRRVYVSRDEDKQIAKTMQHEDRKCVLRLGGLVVHNLGQLLPHQILSGNFNNYQHIFPVGYKSSRFYWSYRQLNKRCRYLCKIEEEEGLPMFSVVVYERGFVQTTFKAPSCKEVWLEVLNPLERVRRELDMVKMFPSYLSGEHLFGLNETPVVKLIESLPGVEMMSSYQFRHGRTPLFKLPLAVNPSGCARTEPKLRMHFKRPTAVHSGGGSGHGVTRGGSLNPSSALYPPSGMLRSSDNNTVLYNKQFMHSKSQQYRKLRNDWRGNVYLRRSNIQGLGLFAAKELEKHTMVIEYVGELIRAEVAEKREKIYDQNNHGVYMFRIENTNFVVDATMSGGPARYINHSCSPNCVAEVVAFDKDRDHKIIIFTKRKISIGEELNYDYKFDLEDDQHKIPCLCASANCRKWMN